MNSNPNSYSLDSESRRWWWPSATAGGVGIAAIAAIVVLPTTGNAMPVDYTGQAPDQGSTVFLTEPTGPTHPCFMLRPRWNTALDGPQPVCGGKVAQRAAPAAQMGLAHTVIRPALDAMP